MTQTSSPVSTCHHFKKPSAPPETTSVPLLLNAIAVISADPAVISFLSAKDGGGSNKYTLDLVDTPTLPLLDSAIDVTAALQVELHVRLSSGCQLEGDCPLDAMPLSALCL